MTNDAKSLEKLKSSAMGAATVRAFAALEADLKIRNPDYLAREFLEPEKRPEAAQVDGFRTQLEGILPGAYHFQNARTMHFDACLTQAIKAGFKQIVILGAGFDSRAYRIGSAQSDVRFFEVDLPGLQAEKRLKIETLLGGPPAHVHYVPLDFNARSLADIQKSPAYDAAIPTFFIWEGVSYYLQPEGVDATLAFIASHAAGSRVVFDFMPKPMVDGSGTYYGGPESRAYMAKFGEPLVFGFEEDQFEAFLASRGFSLVSLFDATVLGQTYLTDSRGILHGEVSGYVRIAEAAVRS